MIFTTKRSIDLGRGCLTALLLAALGCDGSAPAGSSAAGGASEAAAHVSPSSDGSRHLPLADSAPLADDVATKEALAYPGATQVQSLKIADKDREVLAPPGVLMFVTSERDLTKVAGWYENWFTSAGWSVAEQSTDGDYYSLFQKSGREISVSIGAIDEPKPDGHADAQLLIVIDTN
jgi:hypothetical protein